jgi:hypothetical protein
MFISKAFVVFFVLLVSSVIAAPVVKERSPDAELLPRGTAASVKNKITKFLRPLHDKAVFWSGKVEAKKGGTTSVAPHAAVFAKTHGKEVLRQSLKRADIKIPKNKPQTNDLWRHASKVYAEHSSGDVHAVLGSKLRPGNVYHTVEKPALLNNPKVHTLTEHNAGTKKATVVKPAAHPHKKVSLFFCNERILTQILDLPKG